MSASKRFDPVKFIDQLMSDGKRRSERQIKNALLAVYVEQTQEDWKTWLRARNTPRDQGLRLEEAGPLKKGTSVRYTYWRVEQDPDKIHPGDPLKYLPTGEQAMAMAREEAAAFEKSEKARLAKMAGVIEE